ncbi:hypothetical protein CEP54_008849 [Fusarium duplospermum]|uniref:Uncharacterized protein n=1 Tax=Fusarium duplospermum TaxID=1325734 RepID=A0A428PTG9_9HYPO|nr:hypothetical protein CEP54_008849 [Fusarium duplospermum]
MQSSKTPLYKALPAGDAPQPLGQDSATRLQPKRLDNSWLTIGLRLIFDLLVASISLLFAVFGFLVYRSHGKSADAGSTGLKLFQIAQFAPTIFPVLFAAIAGGSLKSFASWRIQTRQGATLGLVEQCLGSQTMAHAFTTQITLRAINFLGIFIVCLWTLSPLGSQASLRVISVLPSYPSTLTQLTAHNTSMEYQFGNANGIAQASTRIVAPAVASLMAASLLSGRNQDLWGNIRFPAIEPLEGNGDKGWLKTPKITNLSYPSLVGTPVNNLPASGNTSFILPGSYLSISCPSLERSDQSDYTNLSTSNCPVPYNGEDCNWLTANGGTQYRIAISYSVRPLLMAPGKTRDARKLIFESGYDGVFTRAECSLTTTFVDVDVFCTGDPSGSICNPSAVRRSVQPTFHYNWTVLDMGSSFNAKSVIQLLTDQMFPNAQLSGGKQPVLSYLTTSIPTLGRPLDDIPLHTIGSNVFGLRLAQLLNTILYLGINPAGFTGSFNTSDPSMQPTSRINITGTNTIKEDIIHCDEKWLAVLLVASFTAFFFALLGAFLRVMTLAPDVLGSSTLALLHNKVEGVSALSTWSSETWARNLKDLRLFLGDVEPQAQVGRIALATSTQETVVKPVNTDRYYI